MLKSIIPKIVLGVSVCFELKQLKVSARNRKIGVLYYASVASSFPAWEISHWGYLHYQDLHRRNILESF